jgi:uncharacterized protein YgiM (DUF1202 family)
MAGVLAGKNKIGESRKRLKRSFPFSADPQQFAGGTYMKRLCAVSILGLVIAGALTAQIARGGTAYVAVKTVQLKSSTGFFAGSRGSLAYGEAVTVLQTKGKWAEVRSNARTSLSGWINASTLTAKRISTAAASTSSQEMALAGKGFSEEVEKAYQAEENLNYADVDRTEAQTVSAQELYAFLTEGHLTQGDAE